MSTIADLVRRLGAAGCSIEQIAVAVELAEQKDIARRAKNAERMRDVRARARTLQHVQLHSAQEVPLNKKKEIKEKKESKRRGERMPPDFQPDLAFAIKKGMSRQRADIDAEKFRNYWTAKSGSSAVKLDWDATWRNWVLQSLERTPPENRPTGPPAADLNTPPWEREGISHSEWKERQLGQIRQGVRGNPGAHANGTNHASKLQLPSGGACETPATEARRPPDH